MPNSVKVMTKDELKAFVGDIAGSTKVIGVRRKGKKFAFGPIADPSELVLDYDVALASPRALFQPPAEKLLDFAIDGGVWAEPAFERIEPFVLFGVHTYDLKALNQMDRIWAEGNADEHYLARRRAATVVAIEPTRASKWSFWAWMGGTDVKGGFDLLLTDIGDKYAVEIGTEKGAKLLERHAPKARDASREELAAREEARKRMGSLCDRSREVKAKPEELGALVSSAMEHPVWEERAKKCYGCGSCNLVCPTCYCFDVRDEVDLSLKRGARHRYWDGCLFEGFAKVGSGENFREHKADRFRHRILRKMSYVPAKIGELACVGCGRCSEACLPDIADPVSIINEIKEGR